MSKNNYTEQQWQEKLTPEQFNICIKKGTEKPFMGKYVSCKTQGTYHCVCCNNKLFDSATKFDSGSGWPSFWDALTPDKIVETADLSHGMKRVEFSCESCGAHLGHVFEDGPRPTGLRYCINSASLNLKQNQ